METGIYTKANKITKIGREIAPPKIGFSFIAKLYAIRIKLEKVSTKIK
jgi:hypothetical protein